MTPHEFRERMIDGYSKRTSWQEHVKVLLTIIFFLLWIAACIGFFLTSFHIWDCRGIYPYGLILSGWGLLLPVVDPK